VIDVDADIDLRELTGGLDAMVHPRVIDAVARELKKPMRLDMRMHGQERQGPDGPWVPRKRLEGRGKKVLRRNRRKLLGKLPTAVIVTARNGIVRAESRAKWAAIHQDGGTAGRGARIPRREFLWISDGLMTLASEELQKAVLRAWGGG
jgi:phage gpG-like protein